jgi:hypothetical protein
METYKKIKIISQEYKYPSEKKLKYLGDGEWVEEPDEVAFEYNGFRCLILRIFLKEPFSDSEKDHYFGGFLNGYVDLPSTHFYFGKNYNDIEVYCHGDLTFSEEVNGMWRIGFDCAHGGDYTPSTEYFRKTNESMIEFNKLFPLPEGFENLSLFNPIYRNIEFCIDECCNIVDQLKGKK